MFIPKTSDVYLITDKANTMHRGLGERVGTIRVDFNRIDASPLWYDCILLSIIGIKEPENMWNVSNVK